MKRSIISFLSVCMLGMATPLGGGVLVACDGGDGDGDGDGVGPHDCLTYSTRGLLYEKSDNTNVVPIMETDKNNSPTNIMFGMLGKNLFRRPNIKIGTKIIRALDNMTIGRLIILTGFS